MTTNTKENTIAYTKNYLADDYESINVKYRRQKVLEILNAHKPRNILEIGCGTESLFEFYNGFENFTVVEPCEEFCNIVNKSTKAKSNVRILHGFFGSAEINEQLSHEKYDFIVISSLIHEVPDYELILKTAYSFCNENTFIHVNVPNARSFHLLWAYEAGFIKSLDEISETGKRLQRSRIFDLEKLSEAVENAGFSVIEKGSYAFKLFNQSKILHLLNDGTMDECLLDSLQKMTRYFPENGAEIYVNCKRK